MPTTVTASDGNTYHLWQLPDLSSPEPSESIEINTLDNDLSNGYTSSVLFGASAGLRTFSLKLPTLAHTDVASGLTVTGVNGDTLSREQYIWELYCENKVSGTPFVFQSSRNNQYYLVRFIDKELTYERMRVKLYSTGLKLQQIRQTGKSVFAVDKMRSPSVDTWVKDGSGTDLSGNGNTFTAAGDVILSTSTNGNFDIWKFNNSTNTGKVTQAHSATFYDIFILMTLRTANFNQTSGVLTGTTATPILIGTNGSDIFVNQGFAGSNLYEYRLNDTLYPVGNQVAPVSGEWGLVHVHFGGGKSFTPQLGQDRTVGTSTKADIDVAEIVMFTSYLPHSARRELVESLMIKQALLNAP